VATFVGRETTSSGEANAASLLHTFGSTVQGGELLLLVVYGSGNTATVWDTPTGWTATGGTGLGSTSWGNKGYYLVAAGGETGVTFSYTSGSRPIIMVVYRFRLEAGEAWDTVDSPNDTTHENTDSGGDGLPVQVFIFEHVVTQERVVVGAGLVTSRTSGDHIGVTYTKPVGYTDVFPGTGLNTILEYGVTTGVLDANEETALWDGYRLGATTEPDEDITWTTLSVFGRAIVDGMLIRWAFPITDVALEFNQNRYTQRRFIGTSLPYDLVSIRLGGE